MPKQTTSTEASAEHVTNEAAPNTADITHKEDLCLATTPKESLKNSTLVLCRRMKTNKNIIFSVLIGLALVLTSCSAPRTFQTQTSQSTVSIDLTPREINGSTLVVDMVMDTHSVNLSGINLVKNTVLTYDGRSAHPIHVPVLIGHHVTGTLQFPVDPIPSTFMITIRNVPDIPERTFTWK